jgi:hypothetical protein
MYEGGGGGWGIIEIILYLLISLQPHIYMRVGGGREH